MTTNREGGHFWLRHSDFEVPDGINLDNLNKPLEMESQNNLFATYLLGPIP